MAIAAPGAAAVSVHASTTWMRRAAGQLELERHILAGRDPDRLVEKRKPVAVVGEVHDGREVEPAPSGGVVGHVFVADVGVGGRDGHCAHQRRTQLSDAMGGIGRPGGIPAFGEVLAQEHQCAADGRSGDAGAAGRNVGVGIAAVGSGDLHAGREEVRLDASVPARATG